MTAAALTPKRMPPPALPGFEHAHRYWEDSSQSWIVQILPGEFYVTASNEVVATVLGSCVSTCIRDVRTGLGGMNHFMLPQNPGREKEGEAMRYGCFAIERLINELLKRGAKRGYLEVKVFGGGHVLPGVAGDVGKSNVEFVRQYLRDEGLPIRAEDVGGNCGRRLRYVPSTGKALLKHLEMSETKAVVVQETEHERSLRKKQVHGDVELF
jgi:chemotaxis protein CheD